MRAEGEQAIKDAYRDATGPAGALNLAEIVLGECEIATAGFYEDERMIWFGDIREVLAILRKLGERELV